MTRRWTRIVAGLAASMTVAALALNVSGVAPIPIGPLGEHQPATRDPGGSSTLDHDPRRAAVYLTPVVENTGPVPVAVVRVSPVGVNIPDTVTILGSLPFDTDDPGERGPDGLDRILLGTRPDPGTGWTAPQPVTGVTVEPNGPAVDSSGSARHRGRAFLVRVTPDPTRETSVLRFDVEYTIGPFHFLTTAWGPIGTSVVICPRDRPTAAPTGCRAR